MSTKTADRAILVAEATKHSRELMLASGRPFTEDDVNNAAQLAVCIALHRAFVERHLHVAQERALIHGT